MLGPILFFGGGKYGNCNSFLFQYNFWYYIFKSYGTGYLELRLRAICFKVKLELDSMDDKDKEEILADAKKIKKNSKS